MLKDTEYAYAVAKVRVHEAALLKKADTERLIAAADAREFFRVLADLGWQEAEETENLNALLQKRAENCWALLSECAPDAAELQFLIVPNDFHNLKAVLKALVSGCELAGLIQTPALTSVELLQQALREKRFSLLPPYLRQPAEQAYRLITQTADGFATDVYLDNTALAVQYQMAESTRCSLFLKIAAARLQGAAFQAALRLCSRGKDAAFIKPLLPQSPALNAAALAAAAAQSTEELAAYLTTVWGPEAGKAALKGFSSFERFCDDRLLQLLDEARLISLGPQPLVAYYFAVAAELKTVRIIFNCKQNGISREDIEKRVRALYV